MLLSSTLKVSVSCRLSIFRSPPTSAITCWPLTTAPRRLVSPLEINEAVLPACTWLLVWVRVSPSASPRLPLTPRSRVKPLRLPPSEKPMPTLALLPLLSLSCWLVLRAASRLISPSATREASRPARMSLPCTVISLSLPAPVACRRTSLPATMVEPAAASLCCTVVLCCCLVPSDRLMLMPPAIPGSCATAVAALFTASAVVAAASACMRPSSVFFEASCICWLVWMALMTGLVMVRVKPVCLKRVSRVRSVVSRASVIAICWASTSMSPLGAITSLPTWRYWRPASIRMSPSVLPTVLARAVSRVVRSLTLCS